MESINVNKEIGFMQEYLMAALLLIFELPQSLRLCWRVADMERKTIKSIVVYSEIAAMLKNFFQLLESLIRSVMYLLILIIGLTATGLGAFLVVLLAFRIGQFLWIGFLKEPWL